MVDEPARPTTTSLSAYYLAHFTCTGIQLPFWSIWLASIGLAPEAIGALLALGYWTSIVVSPAAGAIGDRVGARAAMAVLASIAIAGFLAFTQARSAALLALVSVITFGAHAALLPLAESVTQAEVARGRAQYGRVRLWGSIAFVGASAGAGWLVDRAGEGVVPWLMVAGTAACLLAIGVLPGESAARAEDVRSEGAIAWGPLIAGILLANAIQATHAIYYAFGSLEWAARGIDETTIGALWAEGVIAEVILFAISPALLARGTPARWIAIGAIAAAVRWAALARADHPLAIAGAQALHALSFGATHLGGMELVRRSLPPERLATGQGIYTGSVGVLFGTATPIAGWLYERMHGEAYGVAAVAAAVLAVIAIAAGPAIVRAAEAR